MLNKNKNLYDTIHIKDHFTALEAYKEINPPYTFHDFLNLNIKFIKHFDNKYLTKKQIETLKEKYDKYKPLSYFKRYGSVENLTSLIKRKHMKTFQEVDDVLLIDRKILEYYFDTLYTR